MADDQLSVFIYQFGDADNVSKPGKILLCGACNSELDRSLRLACDSGEFFVAEQMGVSVRYAGRYAFIGGPTIDDGALHEFLGLRTATSEEVRLLSVWGNLDSFVDRFSAVRFRDCTLSPYRR